MYFVGLPELRVFEIVIKASHHQHEGSPKVLALRLWHFRVCDCMYCVFGTMRVEHGLVNDPHTAKNLPSNNLSVSEDKRAPWRTALVRPHLTF